MKRYEALVIGGGPAGYVAAIWLAKAGIKTCLIEKDSLGGTCLNHGCIPTKVLYHYAKVIHDIRKHQDKGISTGQITIDMDKILEAKVDTVNKLVTGVETLIDKNNIDYIKGCGKFVDDHHISIKADKQDFQEIYGDYILIASGSQAILPTIDGLDDALATGYCMTSKEALTMRQVPSRIAIIGGGVIGMEFATIFKQFGSEVTVFEAMDSILPSFSKDLVKRYKPLAKKQGINILSKTKVVRLDGLNKEVTYQTKKGQSSQFFDMVICAVGRKPSFDKLNLPALSSRINDEKRILVNDMMKTKIDHIYAIGDVNGLSMLAHSASKQGIIAGHEITSKLYASKGQQLDNLYGLNKGFSHYSVPQVAFLLPEISQVKNQYFSYDHTFKEGKFMYRSNGMALAGQTTDGMVKVAYDEETQALVYMGILGESAGELIQEGVRALDEKLDFNHLTASIVGHPSLSEALHEAMLDIYKKGIHQM